VFGGDAREDTEDPRDGEEEDAAAAPGPGPRSEREDWRAAKQQLARRLDVVQPFDPWSGRLCTCGPKLALDVYSGCGYGCLYCYVSAYNARCWGRERVRPKKALLRRLERDLTRLADSPDLAVLGGLPVAISNSSDPYPDAPQADESVLGCTRAALRLLADAGLPLLIVTKSALVSRDLDLLATVPAVVAMTITCLDPEVAARLEPFAPAPAARLAALARCAEAGVPTACRVDPLLPGINDGPEALARLCDELAARGVRRVISSTYKHKPDSSRRLGAAFPAEAARVGELLDTRARASGYYYLRSDVRRELLARLRDLAHERGLTMTLCREGLPDLGDGLCDARDLLPRRPAGG